MIAVRAEVPGEVERQRPSIDWIGDRRRKPKPLRVPTGIGARSQSPDHIHRDIELHRRSIGSVGCGQPYRAATISLFGVQKGEQNRAVRVLSDERAKPRVVSSEDNRSAAGRLSSAPLWISRRAPKLFWLVSVATCRNARQQ